MPIFLFPDVNLSKLQGTLINIYIDIKEIWFRIANGQISSNFYGYLPKTRPYFSFPMITWVNNKGF